MSAPKTKKTKTTKSAAQVVAAATNDDGGDDNVVGDAPVAAARSTADDKIEVRLISIEDFDFSKLEYLPPTSGEVPDGSGKFFRVKIQYRHSANVVGPVIIQLGKHFCYGVQPDNLDKEGKVIVDKKSGAEKSLGGYNVPIVMTSQNMDKCSAPTASEQRELDFFEAFRQEIVRYATVNKNLIGKGRMKEGAIEGLVSEILYKKADESGCFDPKICPKLYTKLIYYQKSQSVETKFYGPGDKEFNPLNMRRPFHLEPNVRFDGLYVGTKISVQHHVYDADVYPMIREEKPRLARKHPLNEEPEQHVADTTMGGDPEDGAMQSDSDA